MVEIGRNPDADRRRDVGAVAELANEVVRLQPDTVQRALYFEQIGFGPFDALHLASAEQGQVEVFLTTDDDLVRRARRHREKIRVAVDNPVSWYRRNDE